MKIYLDCYPCFLRQALEAGRMAGADETTQKAILEEVLEMLQHAKATQMPPEIAYKVQSVVKRLSGVDDPYVEVKKQSTHQALALYPRYKEIRDASDDPLMTAVRLSIAGNIIDFGINLTYDLEEVVQRVLAQPFAIDDGQAFRKALAQADEVLYLADNAGETVFDKLLIEVLGKPVVYVVKGAPVINDATEEDARAAGLHEVAQITDNGTDTMGTVLPVVSQKFLALFKKASFVIAKGQANYETLDDAGEKVFCLLQVKCPIIERHLGVPLGSIVLRQSEEQNEN
ncbi:MAG: ARMT1-like domain-containing protein [Chloroflexota bacterium]